MITQAVISENKGNEGYWIAFLCALILAIGALLLPYNGASHHHQSLADYQVAVSELPAPPLAIIAELRLAHEEIHYFYQTDQAWLSVAQLEQDWIAPFVKDKSWEHQGQHQWSLLAPGIYQSSPQKGGPRYLLNSLHNQVDVWLNPDLKSKPMATFSVEGLIEAGWLQVVFNDQQSENEHQH